MLKKNDFLVKLAWLSGRARNFGTSFEHARSIAVTGKGGTGITMPATLTIKILSESGDRIQGWRM